jgi:ATP-dependent helicase HrpB
MTRSAYDTESRMLKIDLPIDRVIPEILRAVTTGKSTRTLLVASPGSGKTTRVPWALAGILKGKVYVLEPRRIAAKLSAERVALENAVTLGGEVGYQFRFERKRRDDTRIVFLTEGTLLRELGANPTLQGIDALVLDEFHERHLQGDLALALAKTLQEGARPDLRIVVMSATLDTEPLEAFLEGATRIELEAPRFPIELEYRARESVSAFGLEKDIRRAVENLLTRPDAAQFGDFLVFLPGMAEIRRAESELKSAVGSRADILLLHGELSKEEQARALGAGNRRKIILATNIAESSVTIPGVNTVIDAGLARIASHSHRSGLPRLETKAISRASAIQRAGRAGRTGPGRVLRLYSKGDFEGRALQEIPEVLRTDLAPVLLDLTSLGAFPGFRFFEAPSKERIAAGWSLLVDLGFVEKKGSDSYAVTEIGEIAGTSSFHPRITRSLVEAVRLGLDGERLERAYAALIAISEGEDLGLDFMEGLRKFQIAGFQSRIRDRLEEGVKRLRSLLGGASKESGGDEATLISRIILAGFHDRVGKKVDKPSGTELLLARGGSVSLLMTSSGAEEFWASGDLFLVLDLSESKRAGDLRAKISARSALVIEEDWLWEIEPLPVEERVEREFDEKKKRWMQIESFMLHDLTLSRLVKEAPEGEAPELPLPEWERIFEAWLADLKKGLAECDGEYSPRVAQRTDIEAWASLTIRYGLLRGNGEEEGFEAETFEGLLRHLLLESYRGARSPREFPDLTTILGGLWAPGAAKRFREETPSFVSLPGRARVPVHYEVGSPVKIESRLQDFFGLTEGPSILKGKLKLSLHLLSPNYRAVQVTEDLRGFWERHYPTVRKEFMRKYPRHKWPENPLMSENSLTKNGNTTRLDDGKNQLHRGKK